jgi:hypothetical protein
MRNPEGLVRRQLDTRGIVVHYHPDRPMSIQPGVQMKHLMSAMTVAILESGSALAASIPACAACRSAALNGALRDFAAKT